MDFVIRWFDRHYAGRIGVLSLPRHNLFSLNCLGGVLPGNQRTNPYYERPIWQQEGRVLADDDKTNNYSEAHNRKLQNALRVDHPPMFKFVDELKVFFLLKRMLLD